MLQDKLFARNGINVPQGKFYIDGVPVTANAAELNALDGLQAALEEINAVKDVATQAAFVVGTEAGDVINVAIQLQDAEGNDMAVKTGVKFYLSSAADANDLEGTGPDTLAIGTDGVLIKDGGDSVVAGVLVSEDDGDIDLDIGKAGADTYYLNLILPNGKIVTSGEITFAA